MHPKRGDKNGSSSTPADKLRATLNRILDSPAPKPTGIDRDLTFQQYDEKIEACFEWLVLDIRKAAEHEGIDAATGDAIAREFIVKLRARLDRHAEAVRRGETP